MAESTKGPGFIQPAYTAGKTPADEGKPLSETEGKTSALANVALGTQSEVKHRVDLPSKSKATLKGIASEVVKGLGTITGIRAIVRAVKKSRQKKTAEKIEKEAGVLYSEAAKCRPEENKKANEFYTHAAMLYRKAAELGNPFAMSNLGLMLETGKGVEKDESEAVEWYKKAAELGLSTAMNNLGTMYEHGNGVEPDPGQAEKLYKQAAELGNPFAMYNLGAMYINGQGVSKEEKEAVRLLGGAWLRKAAALGNPQAIEYLKLPKV